MLSVAVCDLAPLVPVIVMRVGARVWPTAEVVSVSVEVDAVGFGANENDMPRGGALVVSVTWPEKPPLGVTVTTNVAVPVDGTDADEGETLIEKSAEAACCTTSVAAVERTSEPLVPVIVNGYEPAAVSAPVVSVNVDEAPETDDGLKLAETPPGSPLVARSTLAENPPVRVRLTAYVVAPPAVTLWLAGETPTAKSLAVAGWTTSVTVALWVTEPLVPVTVRR